MRIENRFMELGWFDLSHEEALTFGFVQAARTRYQIFIIGLFGRGIALMVRPKP